MCFAHIFRRFASATIVRTEYGVIMGNPNMEPLTEKFYQNPNVSFEGKHRKSLKKDNFGPGLLKRDPVFTPVTNILSPIDGLLANNP